MSDPEFLQVFKSHLTKAVISIVITFVGSLIITVFTVKNNTAKIDSLRESKAEKVLVESQFHNVDDQLKQIKKNIETGQNLIIELLREK